MDDINDKVINEQQTDFINDSKDPFSITDNANMSPPLPMVSGNTMDPTLTPQDQRPNIFKPVTLGKDVFPIPNFRNLATSGTKYYGGFPEEEYLQKLQDLMGSAEIYDEIRRSDYCAKGLLSAIKNPIRSAKWEVRAASESPEDEDIEEFIEQMLFYYMDKGFNQVLSEILSMCDFGYSLCEEVHGIGTDPIFSDDGRLIKDKYIYLKKLQWISPKTVYNFIIEDKEITGIYQQAFGDLQNYQRIPIEYLNFFTIEQEGDNYAGISLLRPCYGSYFRKRSYMKFNAIGIEKFAIGTPIGKVPKDEVNSNNRVNFENALADISVHDRGYIIHTDDYEVDIKFNNYDPQKVEISIDNEDKRMSKAFLASFLELGGGGSYALSTDLSDFFLSGLTYLGEIICDQFNRKIIPRLVNLNFPNVKDYPKLTVSGIDNKAGEELQKILSGLVNAKIVIPDDKLEDFAREAYNLPEAEENLDPNKRQAKPAFGQQDPSMQKEMKQFKEGISNYEARKEFYLRKMNGSK